MLFECARWYDVCMVRKLCLLAAPSFSQMPYTRLFLLAKRNGLGGNVSACSALRVTPLVNLLLLKLLRCVCVCV